MNGPWFSPCRLFVPTPQRSCGALGSAGRHQRSSCSSGLVRTRSSKCMAHQLWYSVARNHDDRLAGPKVNGLFICPSSAQLLSSVAATDSQTNLQRQEVARQRSEKEIEIGTVVSCPSLEARTTPCSHQILRSLTFRPGLHLLSFHFLHPPRDPPRCVAKSDAK